MFPYDAALLTAVQSSANTVSDVLHIMQTIDALCIDGDGLKWFNWEYLHVTAAVQARIGAGGFTDPAWLSDLDVRFAHLYFSALAAFLTGNPCPNCWRILFNARRQTQVTRLQFALAGINAHINHDLPAAILATGETPHHGTPHYRDYTNVNATLDALIDEAKRTLGVRLLGESLPAISALENLVASVGVLAAREKAWENAQILWHLQAVPNLATGFLDTLDLLSTTAATPLLVPLP